MEILEQIAYAEWVIITALFALTPILIVIDCLLSDKRQDD